MAWLNAIEIGLRAPAAVGGLLVGAGVGAIVAAVTGSDDGPTEYSGLMGTFAFIGAALAAVSAPAVI